MMVTKLALAEITEGMVPLAYAIGFAMAYFGPCGNLIGNVLCQIWAYQKVTNVGRLFFIQFFLFAVDAICMVFKHDATFKIWTCEPHSRVL